MRGPTSKKQVFFVPYHAQNNTKESWYTLGLSIILSGTVKVHFLISRAKQKAHCELYWLLRNKCQAMCFTWPKPAPVMLGLNILTSSYVCNDNSIRLSHVVYVIWGHLFQTLSHPLWAEGGQRCYPVWDGAGGVHLSTTYSPDHRSAWFPLSNKTQPKSHHHTPPW